MKKPNKNKEPQSSIGKYFAELKKEELAKNNNSTAKEEKPSKRKKKISR